MDWSSLVPLLQKSGPTIGGILGGLLPIPGGSAIGSIVGNAAANILAETFNVPPTPEAIGNAIATGDPAVVQAKLSEAEARIAADVEQFKAALADVQDARETNLKYVGFSSPIQWAPLVVSIIVVGGFFGTLLILLHGSINFNDTVGQVLLILVGSLVSYMNQVVNYWLGSSAGSTDKSAQIANLTKAALPLSTAKSPKR